VIADRRAEAVEALRALGARFTESGDVSALRERINRSDTRRRHRGLTFSAARQCTGKRRHASPEAAKKAAKRMGKVGITTYRCAHCGDWHNGRARRK
jgi:hypothetical protein